MLGEVLQCPKETGKLTIYYSKTILGEIWGESVPNSKCLEEAALAMNDPSHMTSVDLIVGLAGFPSLRRRRRDNDRPQNSHIVSSDDNKRACPRISHPGFAWFLRPLSWLSSGTGSEGLALLLTLWITILNRLNQVCIQVYTVALKGFFSSFTSHFRQAKAELKWICASSSRCCRKKNRPKNKGFCAKKNWKPHVGTYLDVAWIPDILKNGQEEEEEEVIETSFVVAWLLYSKGQKIEQRWLTCLWPARTMVIETTIVVGGWRWFNSHTTKNSRKYASICVVGIMSGIVWIF